MSRPIAGTLAESYLLARGISALQETTCLHFHPSCYYRPDPHLPPEAWPALIAAVTSPSGIITGVHRTWLDPSSAGKAPVDTRRRAMGNLLGNAPRFGLAGGIIAAGEGIETMLSRRMALPAIPMLAALSAAHLAAILLPSTLQRLYVATQPATMQRKR
jgi:Toprim domain